MTELDTLYFMRQSRMRSDIHQLAERVSTIERTLSMISSPPSPTATETLSKAATLAETAMKVGRVLRVLSPWITLMAIAVWELVKPWLCSALGVFC